MHTVINVSVHKGLKLGALNSILFILDPRRGKDRTKKLATTAKMLQLLADQLMTIAKACGYQSPGDQLVPMQPDHRWINNMDQLRLSAAHQHFAISKCQ